MPPVVAFLVVGIGAPSDAKAPLFALISATALCISFLPTPQTRQGVVVHFTALAVAYASGVGAAWSWLATEQVAFPWYVVGLVLVLVAAAALLKAGEFFRLESVDTVDDDAEDNSETPPKGMATQDDDSLDLAFELVPASYDWMLRRMDALERRIDSLLLFIATLTFAIPTVTIAISRTPESPGFDIASLHNVFAGLALACFLGAIVVGLKGRGMGELKLIILSGLLAYQKDKTKQEFQRGMINLAGEHLDKNRAFIARKALFADILSVIFVAEFVLWAIWVYFTLA